MSALPNSPKRPTTPEEGKILLSRLLQQFPKEAISIAEPVSESFGLYWHKGGDLRIEGEHRLVGEGILRVPGIVAVVLLRLGATQGGQAYKGGSHDRQDIGQRENADKQEGTTDLGRSGGGDQLGHSVPRRPALKCATEATRAWMVKELAPCHDLAVEFFRKVSWPTSPPLMPNEGLADLPLQFVPVNHAQMRDLQEKLGGFGNGEQAGMPYPANPLPPGTTKAAGKVAAAVTRSPAAAAKAAPKDDEAWRDVIVPIPRQGQKRDEYLKHPDTIGSLFDLRHGNDDESATARRRLFGFVNSYEPKGWTKRDGTQMPASQADHNFRAALDQFADWFEKNHPDEKL